ncbi:MAG: DNA mismatch repair protein MutS [bacterium]|nr:DNA mismatch repair protein MutS [bacterium]
MTFNSLLFPARGDQRTTERAVDPPFFADLYLDQIADAMFAGREAYDLKPLFRVPLGDVDAIGYRHEISRDLENDEARKCVDTFADAMRAVRAALETESKLRYRYERERWRLDAAETYCAAIGNLNEGLRRPSVRSHGLVAFRDFLEQYRTSETFLRLADDVASLRMGLSGVTYDVLVGGERVSVRPCGEERDLVEAVLETFSRFRQGATKSYLVTFYDRGALNHIEEKVLEFVAQLYPELFTELDRFAERHADFIDETVARFDREIQFYLAASDYAKIFEAAELRTCYPRVDPASKTVRARETYDMALAHRIVATNGPVVTNDFELSGLERVLVISGPNQGGKTTLARTFGQLHYLAALGCRVAGSEATTFLFDELFTHFERQEDPASGRGKLEDDILRIHDILEHATSNSIIILNEIFASTTARDASVLARAIMERILALDALCVCVTFIDELASMSEKTVSMVSVVDAVDPGKRTFRLERRPADGLAYALSLAERYGLTYDRLHDRFKKVER